MKAIQRNAYISHQVAVILGILAHENDDLRRVAVNKVQALHSTRPRLQINNNGSEGHFLDHNFADNDADGNVMQNQSVQELLPSLNGKAKSFNKTVNLNEQGLQQSSALTNLTDKQVEALHTFPLKMYNPCHN